MKPSWYQRRSGNQFSLSLRSTTIRLVPCLIEWAKICYVERKACFCVITRNVHVSVLHYQLLDSLCGHFWSIDYDGALELAESIINHFIIKLVDQAIDL